MIKHGPLLSWLILVAMFLGGCGSAGTIKRPDGVEVRGQIQLPSGSPLGGGTLILRPESGIHGATAIIGDDGTFALQDLAGNLNVVPGRYQIFISFPNPRHAALASAVNKRYQDSGDIDSNHFIDIDTPTTELVIRVKN